METALHALGVTAMLGVDGLAAIIAWNRRYHWARPGLGPFAGTALAFLFGVFVLPYYLVKIALGR